MRKFLIASVAAISVLLPFAALADSVVQLSFGGYYYPVGQPFTITGTNGNYVMFMRTSGFNQATYSQNNAVLPFTKNGTFLVNSLNLSPGDHVAAFAFAGPLSGPCTGNVPANCRASSSFRGEADFIYGVPPPPPPPFSDGFAHIMNTPVMLASVQTGVQATGKQIWPLLVFVGLIIAFYIFRMVGNSIIASAQARNASRKSYSEEYTPQQITAITDKIKELGDRDSFG